MAIPEAVQLVLQTAAFGVDAPHAARDEAIGRDHRFGARHDPAVRPAPRDEVDVLFASIRSGEKLFEELLTGAEQVLPTPHPHVRTAIDEHGDGTALEAQASQLFEAAQSGHADAVRAALVQARCVAVAAD